MASDSMPHKSHEKHLCRLVGIDILEKNIEEYKGLVKDAEYICKGCGRTAKKAENLCTPEKL